MKHNNEGHKTIENLVNTISKGFAEGKRNIVIPFEDDITASYVLNLVCLHQPFFEFIFNKKVKKHPAGNYELTIQEKPSAILYRPLRYQQV